jgi:hypothetical protein
VGTIPVMSSDQRLRTTLQASSAGVGTARRYVRDILVSRSVAPAVVESVELLTSEMVTYALRASTTTTTQELCVVLSDAQGTRTGAASGSPSPADVAGSSVSENRSRSFAHSSG